MERSQEILEALDFARRFAVDYTPAPIVALLAGSRAKGTSKQNSDYDIVFLYDSLPEGAWREMVVFDRDLMELFAHDLSSLNYFFEEIERPSGEASLACMVDQGIPVLGGSEAIGGTAKEFARNFLAAGPLPLNEAALSQRRYAITDLVEALADNGSRAQRLAIGSALYPALANFVLLANGRWTAGGKAIPATLGSFDPDVERSFTIAFEQLYAEQDIGPIQDLVADVLRPFGGPLRAGFRQQAPSSWRRLTKGQ